MKSILEWQNLHDALRSLTFKVAGIVREPHQTLSGIQTECFTGHSGR